MTQIFIALLLTSATGTLLALILTLLKPITRKVFSGGWHYYMWLVVLLVMVLPIRLNLPEKPVTTPSISETVIITDNQAENIETSIINTQPEQIIQEQPTKPEKASTVQAVKNFLTGKVLLFSFVWLMGAVLLFLIKIVSYLVFLIKIHKHSEIISCPELKAYTNRKVTTRVSDTICSPLIIGIFRPTLLLPKTEITDEQLHNVLAHETTHLKRNDILYKWFVSIVKSLHWFNPIIYFISKQVYIDCEISCDLAVVKNMDEQQEKNYIETILALLTHRNSKVIPLTTGMTGNKKTLKRRFTMIKDKFRMNKKTTIISIVLAVILLISAIVVSGLINGFFVEDKPDNTILYKNDKMNIQFEIPLDWKDKYIVDESTVDEGYITVKHKAIAEKHNGMGTLFYIHKYLDNELEEILLMIGNQTVLWQNEEYAFALGRPTDVQVPIRADSDEEDLALSEDYKAMSIEIEQIEKTFSLIKDVPVPVIENAENLSYMQIRDLQRQANNGHFPWRLDPEQVIMSFLSDKGISVSNIRFPEITNDKLKYVDGNIEIELFKPIDKTENGIWIVRTYKEIVENQAEICAYIKEIKDNVIILDTVEYITREDAERVKELKLSEFDMPNGYYINNFEIELEEFTLTETTTYGFIDWKNDFVKEGEDREYFTTNRNEFIKYIDSYENSQPQMPFFIGVIGDKVISITEKPMM